MPAQLQVKIDGIAELRRKLDGEWLFGRPFKRAMGEVGKAGKAAAQAAAPAGASGATRAKLYYRVHDIPIPEYLYVGTRARRKGVAYPIVLEYSGRHGHQGWLRGALRPVAAQVGRMLQQVADAVERAWASR